MSAGSAESGRAAWSRKTSADAKRGVVREGGGRDQEVFRRRPAADAARRVVGRAVAGAEPAAILALLAERNAAEMRADLHHDQRVLLAWGGTVLVGRRRVRVEVL